MERKEAVAKILESKLVVIIRQQSREHVAPAIKALVSGGVKVLELTSNTPGYEVEIAQARQLYPNILIGAGTVTTVQIAQNAVAAGAQFLVSPNTDESLVKEARLLGVPILMGALTPSEILEAYQAGADFVKLFPAGTIGIAYFKAISAPLDQIPFIAVGGIGLEHAEAWLRAGVSGIGVGGKLVRPILNEKDYKSTVEAAKELIKTIEQL